MHSSQLEQLQKVPISANGVLQKPGNPDWWSHQNCGNCQGSQFPKLQCILFNNMHYLYWLCAARVYQDCGNVPILVKFSGMKLEVKSGWNNQQLNEASFGSLGACCRGRDARGHGFVEVSRKSWVFRSGRARIVSIGGWGLGSWGVKLQECHVYRSVLAGRPRGIDKTSNRICIV